MSKLISKIAGAALFGIAALPAFALTLAHAEPATIRVSDLDLSKASNVATFNIRVDQAAQKVCMGVVDQRNLNQLAACRASVRAEAMDKLSDAQAAKFASLTVASR